MSAPATLGGEPVLLFEQVDARSPGAAQRLREVARRIDAIARAVRPLNLVTLAGNARGKITVAALASSPFRRYRGTGAVAR